MPRTSIKDHSLVLLLGFGGPSIVAALVKILSATVYKDPFPSAFFPELEFVLLMIGILSGVKWSLNVVLMCISFKAKDIEHVIIYLSTFALLLISVCSIHCPFINWIFTILCIKFRVYAFLASALVLTHDLILIIFLVFNF
jgi:hypothetical protein